MKPLLAKAHAFCVWAWTFFGDKRTKNCLLFVLILMTAFGIVAPDTATKLRDIVLSMAF
jgi:hypothetical protein